jgi:hypothetical protein
MTGGREGGDRWDGSITRRRVLATAGLAAAGGVAGCAGDSGGDTPTGGDDGDGDSGTPTGSSPQASDGVDISGESTVSGLAVGDLARQGGNEDEFAVVTTVQNTGEQTTDVFEYNYELALYDADGAEMGTNTGFGSTGDTEVAPGESATINVSKSVENDVDDVVRAAVTLDCDGTFAEGTYCES